MSEEKIISERRYEDLTVRQSRICVTLEESDLSGCALIRDNLTGMAAVSCDARGMGFSECNLTGAGFERCDLSGAAISDCKLDGMTIEGVPVSELLECYYNQHKEEDEV